MHFSKDECECRTISFELEPSQMRSLCLRSKPPLGLRGWTVELDRTEASACEVHLLPNASFMQSFLSLTFSCVGYFFYWVLTSVSNSLHYPHIDNRQFHAFT